MGGLSLLKGYWVICGSFLSVSNKEVSFTGEAEVGLPQNHLFSMVVSGDTHDSELPRDLLKQMREEHTRTALMGPSVLQAPDDQAHQRISHNRVHLQGGALVPSVDLAGNAHDFIYTV